MMGEVQLYGAPQVVRLTDSSVVVQDIELAIRKARNLHLECFDTLLGGHIKSEHFDASCRQVAD